MYSVCHQQQRVYTVLELHRSASVLRIGGGGGGGGKGMSEGELQPPTLSTKNWVVRRPK